eukprot:1484732-Amphidinium_carterae.1
MLRLWRLPILSQNKHRDRWFENGVTYALEDRRCREALTVLQTIKWSWRARMGYLVWSCSACVYAHAEARL